MAAEFGHPQLTHGKLHPDYDANRAFKILITEYNADFLLREIDDTSWEKLIELTNEWSALWMKIIENSSGRLLRPRFQGTRIVEIRAYAAGGDADVVSYCAK